MQRYLCKKSPLPICVARSIIFRKTVSRVLLFRYASSPPHSWEAGESSGWSQANTSEIVRAEAPQFSRGLLKDWNHSRWLMLMRTESQGLRDWKEDTTHYNYIGTIVSHYKDPYPPMKEGSDFAGRTHLPRPTKLNWMPTALWQRTCPSSFVSYSENC